VDVLWKRRTTKPVKVKQRAKSEESKSCSHIVIMLRQALSSGRNAAFSPAALLMPWAATTLQRGLAVERRTDIPSPSEPVVEEDNAGKIQKLAQEYKQALKEHSGTAEDVTVKDGAEGSLNKMAADPTDVERPYKEAARNTVGAAERFNENVELADAVMSERNTADALSDENITQHHDTLPRPDTSTPPK
jgi:hypothetical protein